MSIDGTIHYTYRSGSFILAHNDDPSGKKIKKVFKEIKEVWSEKGWKSEFPARFDKEERRLILDLTPNQLIHLNEYHEVFRKFIGVGPGKTIFDGYDSTHFSHECPRLDLDKFAKDADWDLKHSQRINVTPALPQNAEECTPEATLTRWLTEYPGVIIGEGHRYASARHLLIHNMEALKNLGVTTLFLEFLGVEEQKALDRYMAKEGDNIALPPEVESMIRSQDYSSHLPEGARLFDVIQAAKKHGVRIVGIETEASRNYGFKNIGGHYNDLTHRIKGLNYIASAIIRQHRDEGKYVVLAGNTHVSKYKNVPGLSELLGIPGLIIFDKTEAHETAPRIGFNIAHPLAGLEGRYHAVFEVGRTIEVPEFSSTIIANMNRLQTHQILLNKPVGSWLLRTSESKPGTYVLAVKLSEEKITQYNNENLNKLNATIKKLTLKREYQIS